MSVIPRIFASSAWLLIGAFGPGHDRPAGNGDEARGYANTAVLVAVIFVVTLMVTVIFSRDRSSLESASSKKSERTSLKYASSMSSPATTS